MGCAGSKTGGGVLADAPVPNPGNGDPPSSAPLPQPAEDNGADMKTLMQQNQEMMRLFLASQTAVVSPPLAPSTTTAVPVMVAPNEGGGGGGSGKEVDGGEEESTKLSRPAARTVLPSPLTLSGFSVHDDLQESDSGLEGKAVVSALDAVFSVES